MMLIWNIVISSSQDLESFKMYPLRARRGEKKNNNKNRNLIFSHFQWSNGEVASD